MTVKITKNKSNVENYKKNNVISHYNIEISYFCKI